MAKKKKGEESGTHKKSGSKHKSSSGKTIKIPTKGMPLLAIGLVVGLLLGFTVAGLMPQITSQESQSANALTPEEASDKAMNFISENLLSKGITAKVIDVEPVEGQELYKLSLNISSGKKTQSAESYITKDGSLLFPSAVPTTQTINSSGSEKTQGKQQSSEVPKAETPEVRLFVMSYCPYGLQIEKAYLPVYKLLKDKADMEIDYVSYVMHGKKEIDENLRQYCIQRNQEDKFYDYLSCFVSSGEYESCLEEANIDTEALANCVKETDEKYNITGLYNDKSTWLGGKYPQFPLHKDLNQKYGVRGSPTLIVNEKQASSFTRSPEGLKKVVCSAFETPPSECEQTLSTSTASPGIGGGTGSSSSGSCS